MRTTGKVKWYNKDKGFGFIKPDTGQKDCFVHHSDIQGDKDLKADDPVAFEITSGQRGLRATNVSKIQEE